MNTTTTYGFSTTLALPFAEAMSKTKAALKEEGFGALSEIDVQATLKEKIAVDFERYVILGACNPQLAYRGLQAEHELGLLLPCNVIVHEHDGGTMVSIVDPVAMLGVVDNPALQEIANEARTRLQRVAVSLAGTAGTEGGGLMPLYEFHCPDCGARFEKLVRPVTASADVTCPSCGYVPVTRLFSTFASVGGSSCAPQPGGG